MCISVLSTSHPAYPFIVISNRDEFIARPTLRADWWDAPNSQVLGGRDLQRKERGTWLGLTKQGRIAILTNFREQGDFAIDSTKSRGAMVNSYLCVPLGSEESEEEFVQRLMREVGLHDVGGFTMVFGRLRRPRGGQRNGLAGVRNGEDHSRSESMPGLALVSNRTENPKRLQRIATTTGETHGVSNSHYGDRTWPKVVHGEEYLDQAIRDNVDHDESVDDLIESLFTILSSDSLPIRESSEDWDAYVGHMRDSILIPPSKGEATTHNSVDDLRMANGNLDRSQASLQVGKGAYGTSKQTVILVNWDGEVTFVERTLYDEEGMPVVDEKRDARYDFRIDGWEDWKDLDHNHDDHREQAVL